MSFSHRHGSTFQPSAVPPVPSTKNIHSGATQPGGIPSSLLSSPGSTAPSTSTTDWSALTKKASPSLRDMFRATGGLKGCQPFGFHGFDKGREHGDATMNDKAVRATGRKAPKGGVSGFWGPGTADTAAEEALDDHEDEIKDFLNDPKQQRKIITTTHSTAVGNSLKFDPVTMRLTQTFPNISKHVIDKNPLHPMGIVFITSYPTDSSTHPSARSATGNTST